MRVPEQRLLRFTLKTRPLMRGILDKFVDCFRADNRFGRHLTCSSSSETTVTLTIDTADSACGF